MASKIEIFLCYAHEDEELRKGFEKQLRALKRQGIIDFWHDREITAGTEWEQEIDKHLNTAQIILLLVSPDFMDSDYCYGKEMRRAMERHDLGEAIVIPIILRPVYWQGAPFGKLQALPTDANPILSTHWHYLDEAFFNVAGGILKAVEVVTKKQLQEEVKRKQAEEEIRRQLLEKQEALIDVYEAIRVGRITDPETIRDIASRFQIIAKDPESSKYFAFDAERAASTLLQRAKWYEDQANDTSINPSVKHSIWDEDL